MASVSALVGLSPRGARRGGSRALPGPASGVARGQSGACVVEGGDPIRLVVDADGGGKVGLHEIRFTQSQARGHGARGP